MKITFVLPHAGLAGGIRVVAIYAERLRRRGHEVTVVSQPAQHPGAAQKVRALLKGRRPPTKSRSGPYFDGLGVRHIILDSARPVADADVPDGDAVVATWWETAFAVAALSEAKGRKFYLVQHHEVHDTLPKHISRGSYYLPLKKIAISQWLVDIMANQYGDNEVSLVPNSVDFGQFHALPREKQREPTVGLLYSTTPFKGLEISLCAIERVRETLPNLRVVAFGTEPPQRDLPLPPGSRFTLRPSQDSLRDIYASCDVWLCGSWSEGFGLPILEAMACRCPVVSTRIGGAIDIIEDGVNGYVVETGDAEALADQTIFLLRKPEAEWRQMSNAALARAERYSWDDAAELFERALERSGGARN